MRPNRNSFTVVFLLILCQVSLPTFSQLGIPITISKPKEYDERVLRSERSEDKKFTLPTRLIQNTVTHYNYYFNANTKLNEVLERAKLAFKDDYSTLLPFYNYTLDVTAGDSIQLDSITYKASSGIALHDLRNDWIDNLYLLWGASFYLQKKFDSAYLMFQFINYAFAPKEKDGYYLTIGSKMDGNSAYSISTKEKGGIVRKVFGEPPSRNDAFIWQIRNFLAQDQFAEASSMIVALRNDPVFPKRLKNDLHEVQSLLFYKQKQWDSAAVHLVGALSNATNLQEKARWEYLAAQLFELAGNYKESEKYYSKVSSHTTDPILDIYARLSTIRVNRDGGDKAIEKNVNTLLRMAKQSKYDDYKDIIYYMAAQMQLQGSNVDEAMALLLKSTKFNSNGEEQRNKAFLQLAELSLARREYRQAYNFYDSIRLDDRSLKNVDEIRDKKTSLGIIASSLEIIERQDSLQRIAAMPEEQRKDFVKKLVKQLRKEQGLKDEPTSGNTAGSPFVAPTIPTLFPTNTKGEWYFYNTASRTRGQAEFKSRWGTRPNADNWRRSAVIGNVIGNNVSGQSGNNTSGGQQGNVNNELSFDALYDNLPLTPDQLKISNDSIQEAMLALGKAYIQNIEDCIAGTATLEELRTKFPRFSKIDEVMFHLYYCYNKNGDAAKAAALKKTLTEDYGISKYSKILATGSNPESGLPNPDATKIYEKIYDFFIEGNFREAIAQKKTADSIYKNNYWTPQLLYIEAVYYIKERQDSIAKDVLTKLIGQFGNSPLTPKATVMLDVLSRRKQIEEELRNMVVTRLPGDTATGKAPTVIITQPPKKDTTTVTPVAPVTVQVPPRDTTSTKPAVVSSSYTFSPAEPHYVVLLLNKVDPVFSNEAKNAFMRYNRDAFGSKNYSIDLFELNTDYKLLLIAPFANAQDAISYIDKTRPRTASEIIPWLKGGKYNFTILTNSNFDILKLNKDVDVYKAFLEQHLPGKFQ